MEVIAFIEAAETAEKLLGGVVWLIKEILRARDDVRSLPDDIAKLLQVVEELQRGIEKIQGKQESTFHDREVCCCLQRLGAELSTALEKIDEFERKAHKAKERLEAWNYAKALFRQGATKQKKEIGAICKAIEHEQENLEKALTAATYVLTVNTNSIVHSTAGKVDRIEKILETFYAQVDAQRGSVPVKLTEPTVVADLDRRANGCLDDESYLVSLLIAEGPTNTFHAPIPSYDYDDIDANGGTESDWTRGARESGVEVKNYTKVQFKIEVQSECYLYVFSYDKGLKMPTDLELIFPKHRRCQNKLTRQRPRKFPDRNRHKEDPLAIKLEKHASIQDGVLGQVLLYVVLSSQLLTLDAEDGSSLEERSTLQCLAMNLNSEETSEDTYVGRFLFDIY